VKIPTPPFLCELRIYLVFVLRTVSGMITTAQTCQPHRTVAWFLFSENPRRRYVYSSVATSQ